MRRLFSLVPRGLDAALEMNPDPVSAALLEAVLSGIPADRLAIALACPEGNRAPAVPSPHGPGESHKEATQAVALVIRIDHELVDLQDLPLSRLIPIRVTDDESGCFALDHGLEEPLGTGAMQTLEIVNRLIGARFSVLFHPLIGLHVNRGQGRDLARGYGMEGYIRISLPSALCLETGCCG